MKTIIKTNAARLLDKAGISYELVPYEADENDLSAGHVAAALGQDADSVFKTLVLRGDRTGVFICVIPGNREVYLKKAAKVSLNKNAAMTAMKELLPLTGYIRGGCSPVGMKRTYPTYIDISCLSQSTICVSAGVRGLQMKLDPRDLISYTGATVADLGF